jgi:hypothetical protein
MVRVLVIGHKVRMFKPCQGDGFLSAMKIRNATYFGGEVKPLAKCRKIVWDDKGLHDHEREIL